MTVIAYLRHISAGAAVAGSEIGAGSGEAPILRELDDTHVFCRGDADSQRWVAAKVDGFIMRNILEAPEESTSFAQGAESAPVAAAGGSSGSAARRAPSSSSLGGGGPAASAASGGSSGRRGQKRPPPPRAA